jgi:heavy metal translocating P-type ATPase
MKKFWLQYKTDLLLIAGALAALIISLSGIWEHILSFNFIAIAATLICGFPMFKEAFEAVIERKMSMELSMAIAVLACLAIEQFTTALVITFFVLLAELLESMTVDSGRNVLKKIADLLPQAAIVRKDGKETTIPVKELQPEDIVIVKRGDTIPVDGEITKGNSYVDQSSITGESLPVEKSKGMNVLAGTINQSGILEIKSTGTGQDSIFGKIVRVIEGAQKTKAPIEKTADKLAARLVYFAFAGAIITFIITRDITATISALIVAGACGVAAGTPLAILAGIGRCAREGIIVKGGIYLEQFADVDAIVFDKTGTLTEGKPRVKRILCFDGIAEKDMLKILATAEQHSEHPLAQAILKKAKKENISPGSYEQLDHMPGKGLSVMMNNRNYFIGNSALMQEKNLMEITANKGPGSEKSDKNAMIYVGDSKNLLGGVSIEDTIRKEAKSAISKLRDYQPGTISLLSGDSKTVVAAMGRSLALDEAIGEMLPAEKLDYIQKLKAAGKKVAMIGDGVNDAPALVEAAVGIAMGSGTDIAFESADMILPTNNLLKVAAAMGISKQVMDVIGFNFWGTVVVDSVGIVLALLGFLSPMSAALIHVGSESLFILNSARLFNPNYSRKQGK